MRAGAPCRAYRETFSAILHLCERVAREKFAPFNRTGDIEEPRLENGKVVLPAAAALTARAYLDTGMMAATQDHAAGRMQYPFVVDPAANTFCSMAANALVGYPMIAAANAGLLMAHGSPRQQSVFAGSIYAGHAFGTICVTRMKNGFNNLPHRRPA